VFEQPPIPAITSTSIRITNAPNASPDSADDEIVRLVSADDHPETICVVTSDRALTERVLATGAGVHPAKSFRDDIERSR